MYKVGFATPATRDNTLKPQKGRGIGQRKLIRDTSARVPEPKNAIVDNSAGEAWVGSAESPTMTNRPGRYAPEDSFVNAGELKLVIPLIPKIKLKIFFDFG